MISRIGVDVGGSGVKAGPVDVESGRLLAERIRIDTPEPATPKAVIKTIARIVKEVDLPGPVGIGFPSVIKDGVAFTANNVDKGWIGLNVRDRVGEALGREVVVANDADLAGVAEAKFGAAKGVGGTVLVLTFGTGIGSALITDGKLVPNLELGQIELAGIRPAEHRFSAKARRREDLDWSDWSLRANEFLTYVASVFTPSLIVVGGGISKKWDLIAPHIDPGLAVRPATLGNDAGIVGAALLTV